MKQRRGVLLRLLCLAVAVAWGGATRAAWLSNVPVTVVQPNGDTLNLFATGDEYYNYIHDAEGYTVLLNTETGYYVYAEKVNDHLVASNYVYGTVNPLEKGIVPRLTISDEEYYQRRQEWERRMPQNRTEPEPANHGILNNIVVFVRFLGQPEFDQSYSSINQMFNDESGVSLVNYFDHASWGDIHIPSHLYPSPDGDIIISYQDPFPRDFYRPKTPYNLIGYEVTGDEEVDLVNKHDRAMILLRGVVGYIKNMIPNNLNIDFNTDGKVDNIVLVIRGNFDVGNLLWPSRWNTWDLYEDLMINDKYVFDFNYQFADSDIFHVGVLCHEMNHTLGAPDIYHSSSGDYASLFPVWTWDLQSVEDDVPQQHTAYMKMKYDNWITSIPDITDNPGTYTLNALAGPTRENVAYKIRSSDPNQFFVLEYRNKDLLFDSHVPGKGMIIYRVDTRYNGNIDYNPSKNIYDEIYVFRSGGSPSNYNGYEHHVPVFGSPYDTGGPDEAYFSAQCGRTSFNVNTDPYPFLTNGTIDRSISIFDISEAGNTITFTYGYKIEASSNNEQGGTITGGGLFAYNSTCTLTATPNVGYAFEGWYEGGVRCSYTPDYEFAVGYDRNLTARFVPCDFTVNVMAAPYTGGSVTGSGTYPASSEVTVTATPYTNHAFSGWVENGTVVSTQPSYTFTLSSDRNLLAVFGSSEPSVINGSVVTNADGSQGVVFYINPMGTGGTMVALEDVSIGCAWGDATDINALHNYFDTNTQNTLNDQNGYANTEAIRNQQGTGTGYAADVVDFANGWYLPSANQLRKIYGALPFIEDAIEAQGGTLMTEDNYWSSTECSYTEAWDPMFAMNHVAKSTNCRVRAVRDFSYDGNFIIMAESSIGSMAIAVGGGVYAEGTQVTVAATAPSSTGYVFHCWKEDGVEVSKSQVYTFTARSNRHLVAEFRMGVNIGTVITNADGSKGVVFYTDASGAHGTMVALEDVSEGCAWGSATDIHATQNYMGSFGQYALNDMNGYANTEAIREQQGTGTGYAADVVDFNNGWYLPSANQLRKIYGALPFIEQAILAEGGSVLTDNNYWSSTEYSFSDAWNPTFALGHASKTSTCRVRAVRDFSLDGNFSITTETSFGSAAIAVGDGTYEAGAQVTVAATAPSSSGYVFSCWKEDGVVVSTDQVYIFTARSNRHLVAEFVLENSIGCVVTNADGSKGVVFYTNPSGTQGWMVALEDASSGCPWGDNQNVLPMTDQNPSSVQNMLDDLNGYHNTQILRGWFMDNPDYAASKVDFANGWYLPSEGQLRKLYAALPFIEDAILREGGTTLADGNYWSSSECSDSKAWYSNFAMGNTSKSSNLRVRAIHDVYMEQVAGSITFVGTINSSWSEVGNWINNNGALPGLNDDVLITANCVMNMNATVKSVTIYPRSELTVTANHYLNVTENINNSASSRIILEDDAQLMNPTEDVYVSVRKNIQGYGNNLSSSWYTISTPIKEGTNTGVLTTGGYDLYQYYEQTYYWLNHKENASDFTRLYNGSGYLYASQDDRAIMFSGQVRASNAEFYKSITNSPNSAPINGFNLIGNPFTNNINISSLSMNGTPFSTYYKIVNGSALVVYTDADQEPIRPAEGFFVYGDAGYVCYNTPSKGKSDNGYVRLVLYQGGPSTLRQAQGSGTDCLDRAYLRMNEGEALNKAYVEGHPGLLYFNSAGQDYAVAAQRAQAYNLCFEAVEAGEFTIESSLLNTECHYLHLLDRFTGTDIDLLATPTYSFEATTTDVHNRFVLVLAEGAQPEEFMYSRNRDFLPMLPMHTESTNQPAYYEIYTAQNELCSGWNWWAPTVRTTVGTIQTALGDNVLQIQSQGDLPSGNILPGQMFRIETSAPCTLSLTGMLFTAASITVNPGATWFGYIGESAPITQALNGFPPAVDDKIISQDGGFAVYNGTAWEGTLTTLEPGKGYVYVSTAPWSKRIVFE